MAQARRPTTNLREQAYSALKVQILDGLLPPGAPLAEVELALQLGMSRTPVREALQRLSSDGFVTWVPGRGAFVSGFSVPGIVELFQLREALESYAARLAAASDDRGEIAPFLAEFQLGPSLITERGLDGYHQLCEDFDLAVLRLTKNERLKAATQDLWAQSARIRRLVDHNGQRTATSIAEHTEIARAIAAGYQHEASEAAARHIRYGLRNVIESLAGRGLER